MVSPKLPQVSGKHLVKFLESLDYQVIRQRGSHIQMRKITGTGKHNITVPNHKIIAKGTLNDILTKVGLWNNKTRDELVRMLAK